MSAHDIQVCIFIGVLVLLAALVVGLAFVVSCVQKAREAKIDAAQKAFAVKAEAPPHYLELRQRAITLHYAKWETYRTEVRRLTDEAIANPPKERYRIVYDQQTHCYVIEAWQAVDFDPSMPRWLFEMRGAFGHYKNDPPAPTAWVTWAALTDKQFPTTAEAERWLEVHLLPDLKIYNYDEAGAQVSIDDPPGDRVLTTA